MNLSETDKNQLKLLINTKECWNLVDKYCELCYNSKHREMESVVDPVLLYKIQGYIQALRDMQALPDRLRH